MWGIWLLAALGSHLLSFAIRKEKAFSQIQLRKAQGRSFAHSWAAHYGQVGWGYCDWPSLSLVPAPRKLLWLGWSAIRSSTGCWECEVVISFPRRKERFVSREKGSMGIQSTRSPFHTLFEPLLPSLHSPFYTVVKSYLPNMSLFWPGYTLAQQFSNFNTRVTWSDLSQERHRCSLSPWVSDSEVWDGAQTHPGRVSNTFSGRLMLWV